MVYKTKYIVYRMLYSMKNYQKYLAVVILLFGLISSCTEDLDFDQADDIAITPTIEGSLVYVEAPEFLINQVASGTNFYSQEFNFDAFNANFFAERVLDGIITYEVENTTSKSLTIDVELLDEAGNVLDTEAFTVDPAPTAVLVRQITYGPSGRSIDIIKNTSGIRVSATNLGDNMSTSSIEPQKIILRSSAKFRMELVK